MIRGADDGVTLMELGVQGMITIYYDFTGGGSGEDSSIILVDAETVPSKYASKAVVDDVKAKGKR